MINNKSDLGFQADYGYKYIFGRDLTPDSELHGKVVNRLMELLTLSHSTMCNRYPDWRRVDKMLTTYVRLTEEDEENLHKDPTSPVTIVMPHSYTILETLIAHLSTMFTRSPLFGYRPVSPEDTLAAILLEKVIEQQCWHAKVALDLHVFLRDSLVYSFGVGHSFWKTERGTKINFRKNRAVSLLEDDNMITGIARSTQQNALRFEGNALMAIDPYRYFPDPSVPIEKPQDGVFVGYAYRTNTYALMLDEATTGGIKGLFNVKYLNESGNWTSKFASDASGRNEKTHTNGDNSTISSNLTRPVDIICMWVTIIPEEWGLGQKTTPEKWQFWLAGDQVLLQAKPVEMWHGQYPVAVASPEFTGHSLMAPSRMEILQPMQRLLDWLFTAHIANVRKVVNDVIVYDPFMINTEDVAKKGSGGGKLIRTRRPGFGKDLRGSIMQLPIADVTRNHMADASYLIEWMQRTGVTDDTTMGFSRQSGPDRLTRAEYSGSRMGARNRVERMAMVYGLQLMHDLGSQFAWNVQQYMKEEQVVAITGRWRDVLIQQFGANAHPESRITVSPLDLRIPFDLQPWESFLSTFDTGNDWTPYLQLLLGDQALRQEFDVGRVFSHVLTLNGIRNVENFKRYQIAMTPDAQVAEMGDRGQLAAMPQMNLSTLMQGGQQYVQ